MESSRPGFIRLPESPVGRRSDPVHPTPIDDDDDVLLPGLPSSHSGSSVVSGSSRRSSINDTMTDVARETYGIWRRISSVVKLGLRLGTSDSFNPLPKTPSPRYTDVPVPPNETRSQAYRVLPEGDTVTCLSVDDEEDPADGFMFAAGGVHMHTRVYRVSKDACSLVHDIRTSSPVACAKLLRLPPKVRVLVVGTFDGQVEAFDLTTGRREASVLFESEEVTSIAVSRRTPRSGAALSHVLEESSCRHGSPVASPPAGHGHGSGGRERSASDDRTAHAASARCAARVSRFDGAPPPRGGGTTVDGGSAGSSKGGAGCSKGGEGSSKGGGGSSRGGGGPAGRPLRRAMTEPTAVLQRGQGGIAPWAYEVPDADQTSPPLVPPSAHQPWSAILLWQVLAVAGKGQVVCLYTLRLADDSAAPPAPIPSAGESAAQAADGADAAASAAPRRVIIEPIARLVFRGAIR
jgi:hypothetical protein